MKTHLTKIILSLVTCLFSMHSADAGYVWTQKANFGGGQRFVPFSFSIGSKGYVGSGITFTGSTYNYIHTDFWEYDPTTDIWTQKADIPGNCRSSASGFSIGNKGYITVGWSPVSGVVQQIKTTFVYNPLTNAWLQKQDFPGSARYSASSFTIGKNAYVGLGYSPLKNDFWKFSQATGAWTQVANCGIQPVQASCGFAADGYGYICGGTFALAGNTAQLWKYNPQTNIWVQKTNYAGGPRYGMSAIKVEGVPIVGLGIDNAAPLNSFYAYNTKNLQWTSIPSLPAAGRYGGFSFSVNNKGYIGCGAGAQVPTSQVLNDCWELSWVDKKDAAPLIVEEKATIRVISTQEKVTFLLDTPLENNAELYVCDLSGRKIYAGSVRAGEQQIEINSAAFAKGIYCYTLYNTGSKPLTGKFFH